MKLLKLVPFLFLVACSSVSFNSVFPEYVQKFVTDFENPPAGVVAVEGIPPVGCHAKVEAYDDALYLIHTGCSNLKQHCRWFVSPPKAGDNGYHLEKLGCMRDGISEDSVEHRINL